MVSVSFVVVFNTVKNTECVSKKIKTSFIGKKNNKIL